jgi:hypothetical protein
MNFSGSFAPSSVLTDLDQDEPTTLESGATMLLLMKKILNSTTGMQLLNSISHPTAEGDHRWKANAFVRNAYQRNVTLMMMRCKKVKTIVITFIHLFCHRVRDEKNAMMYILYGSASA